MEKAKKQSPLAARDTEQWVQPWLWAIEGRKQRRGWWCFGCSRPVNKSSASAAGWKAACKDGCMGAGRCRPESGTTVAVISSSVISQFTLMFRSAGSRASDFRAALSSARERVLSAIGPAGTMPRNPSRSGHQRASRGIDRRTPGTNSHPRPPSKWQIVKTRHSCILPHTWERQRCDSSPSASIGHGCYTMVAGDS